MISEIAQRDAKDKCPDMITIGYGDESIDLCKVNNKVCLLFAGYKCEYYEIFLDAESQE